MVELYAQLLEDGFDDILLRGDVLCRHIPLFSGMASSNLAELVPIPEDPSKFVLLYPQSGDNVTPDLYRHCRFCKSISQSWNKRPLKCVQVLSILKITSCKRHCLTLPKFGFKHPLS